jgi:hypothetical protein
MTKLPCALRYPRWSLTPRYPSNCFLSSLRRCSCGSPCSSIKLLINSRGWTFFPLPPKILAFYRTMIETDEKRFKLFIHSVVVLRFVDRDRVPISSPLKKKQNLVEIIVCVHSPCLSLNFSYCSFALYFVHLKHTICCITF